MANCYFDRFYPIFTFGVERIRAALRQAQGHERSRMATVRERTIFPVKQTAGPLADARGSDYTETVKMV